jgi:conjugative transposon TraM protein
MTLNLKHPKYVLPLVALPFLCLFFYVYHSNAGHAKKGAKQQAGFNTSVGQVAPNVKKKDLADKLDAYRSTYKNADGYTAVSAIPTEQSAGAGFSNTYSDRQKQMLDSINQVMKTRYGSPAGTALPQKAATGHYPNSAGITSQDKALASALNSLQQQGQASSYRPNGSYTKGPNGEKERDPMDIFKQQMTYMDSVRKASDPAYQAKQQKKEALAKADALRAGDKALEVHKADNASSDFNTVMPEKSRDFITAVIDENVTGYAGSRIRLRLLEDIIAGNALVKKGTYLYALISGFSGQRVTLTIKSILYNGQLLPVKLDVYDADGLQGLYVPESQFRDFTKDLGTSTIQGVSIQDNGTGSAASQLLMSSADKMFESTSSAIASAIRKNKVKIKYNSYIYLIDPQSLKNEQNR